jgi:predicted N-acetyltransferase YhbS
MGGRALHMTDLPLLLRPELPSDSAAIDKLHERAFGPGRFARTAYRLREGIPPSPGLCFTALVGTLIVGSIRLSPILAGGAPALLLGPLTVDPAFMERGIGRRLLEQSIEAARDGGHRLIFLVGDLPYYGRVGFARVPHGRFVLPGPVDPARFLVLDLDGTALEGLSGPVIPAPAAA